MANKSDKKEVQEIRLDCIIPNRFQPRKVFDPAALKELMDSIRTNGVLEPILVRLIPKTRVYQKDCPPNAEYELIMGERRFRACQGLKMATIPAIVREADDRQMLELALVENTLRTDLNPIERAKAYKQLADTFGLTHQEVAERVGTDRATVTNFIRLLTLPKEIQADVGRQTIRVGHAMAILAIPDPARRRALWQRVKNEDLSVRNLRIIVDSYLHPRGVAIGVGRTTNQYKESNSGHDQKLREYGERIRQKLGAKADVHITSGKIGDKFIFGSISIGSHNEEDFERILKAMG